MNRPVAKSSKPQMDAGSWLQRLPDYSRSLLKIQVPVSVTLATTRKPVAAIRELVPGSILQFEKMCDEMLSLEVGGRRVAEGETVKVGDKFGLRVTSILMPAERFERVKNGSTSRPTRLMKTASQVRLSITHPKASHLR